ncbi:MAG: tryptophan synthase subunit alpha [Armatimonadetes bacterium]|nr:MAG: tryptophan synthase subunit alpha [Armatimonadota bacterium]
MNTLAQTFETLADKNERALVCFVTAGDPDLDQLPEILRTLAEAGCDVIEVGIPFSDPIADGPTIQASSQRALDRGVTPQAVLDTLRPIAQDLPPIVLMTYTNIAMRPGFVEFAKQAREAGVSGVILSDMIPEEAGEWIRAARDEALDTIFLVAPTSTERRVQLASEASTGFVYCVSRTGVTGAGNEVPADVVQTVARVKTYCTLPVCVGFGISTPDHVRMVSSVAEGAVVGSALVDLLAGGWPENASRVREFVSALKQATRS